MNRKYWVCINNDIHGPLEPGEAAKIKGFTLFAWACMDTPRGEKGEDQRSWKRAISFPELASHFFPNYPPPPPEGAARPGEELPSPASPPPTAGIALEPAPEQMAEINRKLDDLLSRRTAAQPPRGDEPMVLELQKTEQIMEKLASGSGREALHLELEPLNRRLDLAEKTYKEMKNGLGRETLHSEMEPISRTLAVTEKAVEELKRDIESRDMRSELEPLNSKLELAERAIEAEDARIALFREEVVARIAALEASLKDFRAELGAASRPAAAPAESPRAEVPGQTSGSPAARPLIFGLLGAALLAGALALYPPMTGRGTFPVPAGPAPASPVAPAPAPAAPAAAEAAEITFARAYRPSPSAPELAAAIAGDAAQRGGLAGKTEWTLEPVSPSYARVLAAVPKASGGRLDYYYGVYPVRKRVRALNRAAARTLAPPAPAAETAR